MRFRRISGEGWFAIVLTTVVLTLVALAIRFGSPKDVKTTPCPGFETRTVEGTFKKVEIEGHTYILRDCDRGGGICHDANCSCGGGRR